MKDTITTISFDGDGTLWDFEKVMRHSLQYALDALRKFPERCGLGDRFRFVVFSQDVGFEKPDPRIFAMAAQKAGCGLESLLHVGDSLADDVAGAQGTGARSVWLNRKGLGNETGIRPDYEIASLRELTGILGYNRRN